MNILLTSAGRRGYLVKYFKEALGIEGVVHVANSTTNSTAMKYGDESVVTPLIYDDNYIPFLKLYCKENQIGAIIPLFDVDLPILSKNIKGFEEIGVKVIVSNEKVIGICNDKWKTFEYLKQNNFQTTQTYLSVSSALNAVNEGLIQFPLIIKPRWGMGSIAVYEADNKEELKVFYEKVKKNIQSSYLSYESDTNSNRSVIIQEKIVGQEYGLDIINDLNGNYITTIVKKKNAMRSGETDCAETVKNLALERVGEQIGKTLGHVGNLDVDAFCMEGVPYILEMNARFGGGYPFSHQAGVNLPKAIVSWLKHETVEQSLFEAETGIIGYKDIQIIVEGVNLVATQKLKECINEGKYV